MRRGTIPEILEEGSSFVILGSDFEQSTSFEAYLDGVSSFPCSWLGPKALSCTLPYGAYMARGGHAHVESLISSDLYGGADAARVVRGLDLRVGVKGGSQNDDSTIVVHVAPSGRGYGNELVLEPWLVENDEKKITQFTADKHGKDMVGRRVVLPGTGARVRSFIYLKNHSFTQPVFNIGF